MSRHPQTNTLPRHAGESRACFGAHNKQQEEGEKYEWVCAKSFGAGW